MYKINFENLNLRLPVRDSPANRLCKFAARHWDAPRGRGTGSGQTTPHPCWSGQSSTVNTAGRARQAWALGCKRPWWGTAVRQLSGFGRGNRAGSVVTEGFHRLPESQGRRGRRRAELTRRRYWKIQKLLSAHVTRLLKLKAGNYFMWLYKQYGMYNGIQPIKQQWETGIQMMSSLSCVFDIITLMPSLLTTNIYLDL